MNRRRHSGTRESRTISTRLIFSSVTRNFFNISRYASLFRFKVEMEFLAILEKLYYALIGRSVDEIKMRTE